MKVLNLYAGIGGNRKLWQDVKVTAVEKDPSIAEVYQNFYKNDIVVCGDAHEYLLEHYREFDFIWSSPPCQSHSSMRQNLAVRFRGTPAIYPDMKLYQEIIFLQHNARCQWVIENVNPYYDPLIKPTASIQRHLFWSNFPLYQIVLPKDNLRTSQIDDLQKHIGLNIRESNISEKRQVLRNCVFPELGELVLQQAKTYNKKMNVSLKERGEKLLPNSRSQSALLQTTLF